MVRSGTQVMHNALAAPLVVLTVIKRPEHAIRTVRREPIVRHACTTLAIVWNATLGTLWTRLLMDPTHAWKPTNQARYVTQANIMTIQPCNAITAQPTARSAWIIKSATNVASGPTSSSPYRIQVPPNVSTAVLISQVSTQMPSLAVVKSAALTVWSASAMESVRTVTNSPCWPTKDGVLASTNKRSKSSAPRRLKLTYITSVGSPLMPTSSPVTVSLALTF